MFMIWAYLSKPRFGDSFHDVSPVSGRARGAVSRSLHDQLLGPAPGTDQARVGADVMASSNVLKLVNRLCCT